MYLEEHTVKLALQAYFASHADDADDFPQASLLSKRGVKGVRDVLLGNRNHLNTAIRKRMDFVDVLQQPTNDRELQRAVSCIKNWLAPDPPAKRPESEHWASWKGFAHGKKLHSIAVQRVISASPTQQANADAYVYTIVLLELHRSGLVNAMCFPSVQVIYTPLSYFF